MERGGGRGEGVFLLFFSRSSQRRRADRVCRRLRTRAKRRRSRQKAKWNGIKSPMAKRGGGKKRPSGRRKWKSGTEFAKRHRRVNGSYNESACDRGPKTRFGCLSFDWKVCRCFFSGQNWKPDGSKKKKTDEEDKPEKGESKRAPFCAPLFFCYIGGFFSLPFSLSRLVFVFLPPLLFQATQKSGGRQKETGRGRGGGT